ncbi:hypothetical protein GM661_10185 [Iocasia frigidifontis]|uniref:PIN domain-containing protein n=1 Tax=Iocasia fonsfrigidae TaxID=2682810 RepID=A0A8A7KAQ5_9FIRM|nr:hypothetical protein [Iocasia fonsfrigidae]QTL98320.1 hypothetical protein GM661_10185 [Iocasia fonsfrigidae]
MMTQDDILINRLSHFVPNSDDDTEQTKQDLVLSGLYHTEKSSVTVLELKEQICNSLGVQLSKNELVQILNSLVDINYVLKSKNKFMLIPEKYDEIKEKIDLEHKNEDKVLNIWLYNEIRPHYIFLSNSDLKIIKKDIVLFLKTLFIRHGLESLSLIMNNINNLFQNSLDMKSVIDSLPNRNKEIKLIEYNEFPGFFSRADKERAAYLIQFLDKAFKFLTVVCDPKIMDNFKEKVKGKKIYLDSSVVYRLENLQGEDRHKITKEVVEMCHSFDIDLRVSMKTLEELKERLSYDAKLLKKYPVKIELAKIGYSNITQENYVTTYWRENSIKGTSLKDFINHYKHIDDLLKKDGINVEKKHPDLPNDFNKKINEYILIFRKIDPEGKIKMDYSVEHDAYNLAVIDYYRDDECSNIMNTNAWFLTTDHFIINLQKTELKNKVPLAILPSQLIQILRFVTPVNNLYNEAFINLFSNSLKSSRNSISTKTAQEILSRIGKYKGSPSLAKKILLDSYFVHQFEKCKSDGEKEEMIYDNLISKAEEMKIQLEKANKKINIFENTKEELTFSLRKEVEKNRKLIENIINHENQIRISKEEIAANNRIIDIQNQLISFMCIFVLCVAIIYILIKYFGWTWTNFSPIIENILKAILYILLPSSIGFLLKPFVKKNIIDKLIYAILQKNNLNNDD